LEASHLSRKGVATRVTAWGLFDTVDDLLGIGQTSFLWHKISEGYMDITYTINK